MIYNNFTEVRKDLAKQLYENGYDVKSEKWQGIEVDDRYKMFEVLNVSFTSPFQENFDFLKADIEPNLPWADDHFLERVGRLPLNPGVQYANWPFYRRDKSQDKHRTVGKNKFTHSYMERIWPPKRKGIRYKYGNFDDVISLLEREPHTRQAYLPIWYPEDTGVKHGGRVPCSLGYWFINRNDQMHVVYTIRSCDMFRHLQDDIYFACRKVIWALEELRKRDSYWDNITTGTLTMHIGSLHIFAVEKERLLEKM